MKPTLYIFSGLPATGKTTLAMLLAKHLKASYLRIDTIEQALRDLCGLKVQGEGYRLAYRVAADNLKPGNCVVADSCNPIELTRREWEEVATKAGGDFVNIEIICSDKAEHKKRVENRNCSVENLVLPDWKAVLNREYHQWTVPHLVIDTAGENPDASFEKMLEKLKI